MRCSSILPIDDPIVRVRQEQEGSKKETQPVPRHHGSKFKKKIK